MENKEIQATLLEPTEENIQKCAEFILKGGIVGMPTETVYGLAANAFDVKACEKIFEYKGRPLNDPLIVHVCSKKMVEDITLLDRDSQDIFKLLSDTFWPGPLTIILKANLTLLDRKILAGGDTVGIRYPINEIALKFIKACGVPIAAPSANKFCHISPVNPFHVYKDFQEYPVMIINGGVCNFCMESTVIKIIKEERKILICRMGAVAPDDIRKVLLNSQSFKDYKVECLTKKVNISKEMIENINNNIQLDKSATINQEAPGQFLKHYSPKLKTFLYSGECDDYVMEIQLSNRIMFIDYMGILYKLFEDKVDKENFLELSHDGNVQEVMKNFYDYLHKAELYKDKDAIIICDFEKYMDANEHKLTLLDRSWKASSFMKAKIIY